MKWRRASAWMSAARTTCSARFGAAACPCFGAASERVHGQCRHLHLAVAVKWKRGQESVQLCGVLRLPDCDVAQGARNSPDVADYARLHELSSTDALATHESE